MFLVTGITGQVGGATARGLLAKGKQVRALVRDPQKAAAWASQGVELIQGDFDDSASLAQALKGVEGAYLMMPPNWNPSPGFPEAKAVVASYEQALAQSPVPRLVTLSSIGSEKSERLGLITATAIMERALEQLPFPVAFVRAGSFIENFLFALESGKAGVMPSFYQPTDRKVPMIASEDIGAEVARLLTTNWTGKRYIELGSLVSPDELAEAVSEVLGTPVKAQAVPRAAWSAALEGMGFPKGNTAPYEEMADNFNSGWIAFGVPGTEKVEGTTPIKQVFAKAAGK
jgi:uncharacterized protein YbjT (DUF2867 family)